MKNILLFLFIISLESCSLREYRPIYVSPEAFEIKNLKTIVVTANKNYGLLESDKDSPIVMAMVSNNIKKIYYIEQLHDSVSGINKFWIYYSDK